MYNHSINVIKDTPANQSSNGQRREGLKNWLNGETGQEMQKSCPTASLLSNAPPTKTCQQATGQGGCQGHWETLD